jgi:hypothetical protein
MRSCAVARIPVVENGDLVGIVSLGDLAQARSELRARPDQLRTRERLAPSREDCAIYTRRGAAGIGAPRGTLDAPSGIMDRPLWQILIPIFLLGVAAHRAALGFALYASHMGPAIAMAYGLQTAAALATALAIWLGRAWAVGVLVVLGISLAAAAILEGFWLGLRPPIASVAEMMMIALSTGALALVFRREFGSDPERRERL